jgi:hypothetical protein
MSGALQGTANGNIKKLFGQIKSKRVDMMTLPPFSPNSHLFPGFSMQ